MESIYQEQDREKVELYFSCRNLKDKDTFSKSDPQVIVHLKENRNTHFKEIFRTEQIKDSLNPDFVKTLKIDFIFETQQYLKLEVLDIDGNNSSEFLGEGETTISNIMGSKGQLAIVNLTDKGKKAGKLVIRAEKVSTCNSYLVAQISGKSIKNKHWFHKNSSYFRLYKVREDNMDLPIYQSETIKANLNPVFKAFELSLAKATDGDFLRPIKLVLYDEKSNGKHDPIGSTSFSPQEIKEAKRRFELKCRHGKHEGDIIFTEGFIKEVPTFIDFLRGGTQISMVGAIDYTASNGLAHNPSSLHYIDPNQMNQYQQAIWEVSQILLNYDYDQRVPLFGFGGAPAYPGYNPGQTLHCFPVNGNVDQPEVYGTHGIMEAYTNSLRCVKLNGPTLFGPIIDETLKLTSNVKSSGIDMYVVLLILTDGEIHDMDHTISSIISAEELPLSIIIIGVGDADFTKMEILDGDNGLVDSRGRRARRDLVQFVPFNRFKGNSIALANEVLKELPTQLVKYKEMVGQKPGKAVNMRMSQLEITGNF